MAEFLLRIEDKKTGVDADDYFRLQRGDLVVVAPDGWNWGSNELGPDAHSFWRVVKAPSVSYDQALVWAQREIGNKKINPWLRRRLRYLDIDALPGALKTALLSDSTRINGITLTSNDVAAVANAIVVRSPGQDPGIIG